jgi:hypothetical protein
MANGCRRSRVRDLEKAAFWTTLLVAGLLDIRFHV